MPTAPASIVSHAWILPYLAVLLIALIVLVLIATIYFIKRPKQRLPPKTEPTENLPTETSSDAALRHSTLFSMRRASRRLQGVDLAHDHPYSIPWFILLGPDEAKPRRLTEALEPAQPNDLSANIIRGPGYRVVFSKDGAVVEIDPHLWGGTAWSERWQFLLWLLRAARPERPADGIVIAIPASWLLGLGALPMDRLADQGAQFYEAIWQVQRRTGLRLPVYLTITGCETLDGFAGLVQTLGSDLRNEVLGWSTPQMLEEAFEPEHIDRAVGELVTALGALQLQLFGSTNLPPVAERQDASPVSDLFLLPGQIQQLATPLRILLSAMLRTSVYHEPFLFRGFYLTGSVSGSGSDLGHEAFARGLFRHKIFREFQMARPARGVVTIRSRRLRTAQISLVILAILGVLGLVGVGAIMPRRAADVGQVLAVIDHEAMLGLPANNRDHPNATDPLRQSLLERKIAQDIIQSFEKLTTESASSPLVPTSYLEGPNQRIITALSVGYQYFVLGAIRDGLEQHARTIFQNVPNRDPNSCGTSEQNIPAEADIARFGTHVSAVIDFDQYLKTYDTLSDDSITGLQALVHYTLDQDLPPDFHEESYLYAEGLARAKKPPVNGTAVSNAVRAGLSNSIVAATSAEFDAGHIGGAAATISKDSDELIAPGIDPARIIVLLTEIRTALKTIQNALANTNQIPATTVPSVANLGVPIEEAMTKLAGTPLDLIPAGFVKELQTKAENCRTAASTNMLKLTGVGGQPLFENMNGRIQLAARYTVLETGLDELFAEDFMHTATGYLEPGNSAKRVSWDVPMVGTAERALERYTAIMSSSIADAPSELRSAFRAAAQYQLANFVLNRVASARRVQQSDVGFTDDTDGALRGEIRNFASVEGLFANLGDGLSQAGLDETSGQVIEMAQTQAQRLLGEVSTKLDAAALYQPVDPSFSWWNGTTPLAARSFGAATQADLAARLGAERTFIEDMAHTEAEPLISFLTRTGASVGANDNSATARWVGILNALAKSERKAPDSSLSVIENFILTGMDQVDLVKCHDSIAMPALNLDYFGDRLQQLESGIFARCDTLQRDRVTKQYREVTKLFNETLADRFPFALPASSGKIVSWADPDDIRRFYQAIDAGQGGPMAPWLKSIFGPRGLQAAAFIDRIEEIRSLLQPIITTTTPDQLPTWETDVEFRANPELDQAGNQVLEWAIESAGQRLSSLAPKHPFVWGYGQPVRLTVRWARNAPSIPVDQQTRQPIVTDVTAAYAYDDPWGLFSLLEDRSAAHETLLPFSARRPETIVLNIPLQRNQDAAIGGDLPIDTARLYVRFRLNAIIHTQGQPDKRVPVVLSSFPTQAPSL